MNNKENPNLEDVSVLSGSTEKTDIENGEIKKQKPILPIIIFGVLGIIAVAIVVVILTSIGKNDFEENIEVPAEPEEIQVGLTDYSATDKELSEIKELNSVLDSYVVDYYEKEGIVSAYGFLFSTVRDNNIMVRDLMAEGLINPSKNVYENTDILYMKASDLGLNGNDFVVCTAFNTKDGYYLSSSKLKGKYYNQKDYHDLVFRYSFVHGNIKNPKKGDSQYEELLKAASITSAYDVKHLACDDKYAVIVANNVNNTSEFVEVVLVKTDGKWSVGIGNVANAKNAKQTVNKQYPDMELGLLPIYNIGDYPSIMSDLTNFTNQLLDLGMLNESEMNNLYTCSAGSFAYIQTEGGRRLFGYMNDDNKLEFIEVSTLEEAIASMVKLQKDPPVFIIKFN